MKSFCRPTFVSIAILLSGPALFGQSAPAQGVKSGNETGQTTPATTPAGESKQETKTEQAKREELQAKLSAARPDQVNSQAKALEDVRASAARGEVSGISAKLAAFNQAKPDTAEWHLETTHQLLDLAEGFSRSGKRASSDALVGEALKALSASEAAARTAGDKAGEARAKGATARVQDRYQGDPVSALANYRAALELAPNDAGLKEAYDRLDRSYQNILARSAAKKR